MQNINYVQSQINQNIYKPNKFNLAMKKQVKKYGNSLVIQFSKEECKIYDIEQGKIFELELNEVKDGLV